MNPLSHNTDEPHPMDRHVGQRIMLRRSALSMTQEELARRVGERHQKIREYEYGKVSISASKLWELACALGVPPAYFFDVIGQADRAEMFTSRGDSAAPEDTRELVDSFERIKEPDLRQQLLYFVQAFALASVAP